MKIKLFKENEVRIRDLLIMWIAVFFIVIFLDVAIGLIFNIGMIDVDLLMILMDILVIYFIALKSKVSKKELNNLIVDFKSKINIKELFDIFINTQVIQFGITYLTMGVFLLINISVVNEMLNGSSSRDMLLSGNIFLNSISIAIIAPVIEELIYRKVIFKRLSKKMNVKYAIILSSVIFGLLHAADSIIFATLFGIILCIMYLKYDNILIPMFLHFINNSISTILLYSSRFEESTEIVNFVPEDLIFFLGVGTIVTIIGAIFYVRIINKNKKYVSVYSKVK